MGAWGSTLPGIPQSPRRVIGDTGTGYLIGLSVGVLYQIREGIMAEKIMMKKGLFRTSTQFFKYRLRKSVRPAIRFGNWTFWFSLHNVMLLAWRGVDDMLNPIFAAGLMPIVGRFLSKKRYTFLLTNKKRSKRLGQSFLGSHQSRRWHKKWKKKFMWSCAFLATLEGVIGIFRWINGDSFADEVALKFGEPDIEAEEQDDYLPFRDRLSWMEEDDDLPPGSDDGTPLDRYMRQWRVAGLPPTWLE